MPTSRNTVEGIIDTDTAGEPTRVLVEVPPAPHRRRSHFRILDQLPGPSPQPGRARHPEVALSQEQPNNPLHGVTLKALLQDLIARYGFEGLAERIPIACFQNEPSLKSSLKFLRRTDWARAQAEKLYFADQAAIERRRKQNKRRASKRAHRAQHEAEQQDP